MFDSHLRSKALVATTYHGDDFGLNCLVQGDETKVEHKVKLKGIISLVYSDGCM